MSAMRICSILWMGLGLIFLAASLRTKRMQERVDMGSRLIYGIPVFLAFYLMFTDRTFFGRLYSGVIPRGSFVGGLGIALTAFGIGFALWARFYLGGNWSSAVTIKVGHRLIRTGPYTWVRHPIYSGLLLAIIGTALVRRQFQGLLAVVLLWLAFWVKSRMEERFMFKTFGSEYEEYSRTTGALIPRIRS